MARGGLVAIGMAKRAPALNVEYAVYCMEPARLSVVFAYIPVHGTTQSRTFGAASFYIYNPPALECTFEGDAI